MSKRIFRFPNQRGRWQEIVIERDREQADLVRSVLVSTGVPFREYERDPQDPTSRVILERES